LNRKKKINQILKAKKKRAQAKKAPTSNKPRYISKAEREAQASQELEQES